MSTAKSVFAAFTVVLASLLPLSAETARADDSPPVLKLAMGMENGNCLRPTNALNPSVTPLGPGLTAVPAGRFLTIEFTFSYTVADSVLFTMPTRNISVVLPTNVAWLTQIDNADIGVLEAGEFPFQVTVSGGSGSSAFGCTGTIIAA
ncbi:hypothetical protein AB0N05_35605 [Nocardia sp. NPDC051030]|uniref:hypothetical protein n=1 Tax=Nocardia sp. NPDC051030 TaxID=3155162 RepID=UPI00343AC676